MIKRLAVAAVKSVPVLWRTGRSASLLMRRGETELQLLPFLVDPSRLAVDIGGNTGLYSHALLALGANVVTVEANPNCVATLRRLYGDRISLFPVAVSDRTGKARLRFPASNQRSGLATLEAANQLSGLQSAEIEVEVARLDDLVSGDVGFIKIDVEGHELAVLQGAAGILGRCRPILLIEAEERHRPKAVRSIVQFLKPFGYTPFAVWHGRLHALETLDIDGLQAVSEEQVQRLNAGRLPPDYVNNFIFIPSKQMVAGKM